MRDNLYERTDHTFGHVTGNCEHCETGTEYYTCLSFLDPFALTEALSKFARTGRLS